MALTKAILSLVWTAPVVVQYAVAQIGRDGDGLQSSSHGVVELNRYGRCTPGEPRARRP